MSTSELILGWKDGRRVVYPFIDISESQPEVVREGLARRRMVALGEECPCGATLPRLSRAQRRAARKAPVQVQIHHESDCAAISLAVEVALRQAVQR